MQPSGKKIILVDDDTFLLGVYANRFVKSGFDVSQFNDPTIALEKIRGGLVPNVLLLDVIMPGMSGLDLLEKIRGEKLLPPTTTVIILTNQSDSAEMARAQSLGIDGYIIKATSIPAEVVDTVIALQAKHQPK
jgi:DNA-binding response OmpR family regulator